MAWLDRFFGPSYEKELKQVQPLIEEINSLEPSLEKLTAEEFVERTKKLRHEVQTEERTLDELLPEAYALVRESAKRTVGMRHYDVQLVGGVFLHRGRIAEMRTGEGKTLVGTLPAYLNALTGKGVHIVTVNDYLARRDAVWMGQIHAFLGLSVGVINHNESFLYDAAHTNVGDDTERDEEGSYKVHYEFLRPCSRQEAYRADITYGTNNEFGFDYLRDNIEFEQDKLRQHGHAYAIVDEIDSILIDEARTPLIISAPAAESENLYTTFARVAQRLHNEEHFTIDEKLKAATLTDAGVEEAQKMLGIDNIYTDRGIKYVHHLETAVRAKALFTRDKEYVVRDNEVVIVDEFTGRLQPGRRWSDGLHQAIEAKEGVRIQQESRTYASVTYQNYFRMYDKLSGMTGTALTSQEEFFTVYQLDVIPIPTNQEIKRIDHNDQIYQTEAGKNKATIAKIKSLHEKGQPVLIGTVSIEKNEELSHALTAAGVKHLILNAKNHEHEGEIIAAAGKKGAVTLATNMAGRGVDIKLGGPDATEAEAEEVKTLGGLFVLGTERHEARRIDNQLRGRAGRQGDPGETQFFVSMEDSLMRVFGGERIRGLMGTFGIPEDQPIENRMITRQLESAQTRIEGFHFDSRKQVLAYDDVLNRQRMVIYERRSKLLAGDQETIDTVLQEVVEAVPDAAEAIEKKKAEFEPVVWKELVRKLLLQITDIIWVEHLEVMQYTRSSVNLRAYGQRDPLLEYRKEGSRLFSELQENILYRVAEILPNVQPAAIEREESEMKKSVAKIQEQGGGAAADAGKRSTVTQRVNTVSYGRNDMVTITNGTETKQMKYKKAEPLVADGEWKLV